MRRVLAAFLVLAVGSSSLAGWGGEGHQAIGIAAQKYLQGSPAAAAKLTALLGADWTVAQAATWPDDLKQLTKHQGPLLTTHNAESIAFNHGFPQSPGWHFVDVPLPAGGYEHDGFYASKNDILHAIAMCLNVLNAKKFPMGQFADAKLTPAITKAQALRFLIHLTGDLHQPMHVGSGYYNVADGKPVDPVKSAADANKPDVLDDHGANALFYTKSQEFHAYWDTVLPQHIANTVAALADAIGPVAGQKLVCPAGKPAAWPQMWANDSLQEAKHAYEGIQFAAIPPVVEVVHGTTELKDVSITGPGAEYVTKYSADVKNQLTLAAQHLGCLLQAVAK